MFQHQFSLSPEAADQAGGLPAFAAGPSLTASTAYGGESVPTGKRHRASSPRPQCSREAAASFTPPPDRLGRGRAVDLLPGATVGFLNPAQLK